MQRRSSQSGSGDLSLTFTFLAYSKSTANSYRIIGKAHEICSKWTKTHGASFAPHEYDLIKNSDLTEPVRLDGTDIEPDTSIRILGLPVDTKLRHSPQIAQLQVKAATQAWAMKCLTGST